MPTRWTEDRAGLIYAGASNRTADELNAAVILLARDEGWDGGMAGTELFDIANSVTGWLHNDSDSEWLSDETLTARDWLNEHIAPAGYIFEFDEGFHLWTAPCGNCEHYDGVCMDCRDAYKEATGHYPND